MLLHETDLLMTANKVQVLLATILDLFLCQLHIELPLDCTNPIMSS